MQARDFDPAGHGKDPRLVQPRLPLEHEPCLDTSISLPELVDLPLQPSKLVELPQPNLSNLIPMPNQSCDRTGETSQFTPTSKILSQPAQVDFTQLDFHVQEPAGQEQEPDLAMRNQHYGLKLLESSMADGQNLLSSKTLKDLSIQDFEQYLVDSEWLDIHGKIRSCYRQNGLGHLTKETDYLSLPTLTTNKGTYRKAGQSKCEKWFRDNGLLQSSQCLSPQLMAQLLGFPPDWTRCLWEWSEVIGVELPAESCLVEPLSQPKQRSHSEELSTSVSAIADKLPLEQESTVNIYSELHDRIAQLERKRDEIRSSGQIATAGVWIEYGKVAGRKFRQAYYRSRTEIFPPKSQSGLAKSKSGLVKRQYLGEENSKEVKAAGEAIARRNELERITKEIRRCIVEG